MEMDAISAFIDDELPLDEKIVFVQTLHADGAFKDETVELLEQEMMLRTAEQVPPALPVTACRSVKRSWEWLKPVGIFGGGLVTALLVAAFLWGTSRPADHRRMHRFVVYQPDVQQAAITGDFTNWQAVDMQSAGQQGYWEVYLDLPPGEHRYSFLLDGRRQVADPTRNERELDDFGGLNSILIVQSNTKI